MSAANVATTLIEAIVGGLLILGFMYEEKVITFEQWLMRKIRRLIYNIIVAYEDLRDLAIKLFRKRRSIKKVLFFNTYKYHKRYKAFSKLLGEDNEDALSARQKYWTCHMIIEMCGLEKAYKAYCKKQQKNNRVSGN